MDTSKWEKSCLTKKRYDSLEFAEKVVAKIKVERNEILYTYRCASCESWHLTKQPKNGIRYNKLRVC